MFVWIPVDSRGCDECCTLCSSGLLVVACVGCAEIQVLQTKVAKGKEILARRFVEGHPGIHNFWGDFKGMDTEQMVQTICANEDYRMLMSNLTNKAMQFELLYVLAQCH